MAEIERFKQLSLLPHDELPGGTFWDELDEYGFNTICRFLLLPEVLCLASCTRHLRTLVPALEFVDTGGIKATDEFIESLLSLCHRLLYLRIEKSSEMSMNCFENLLSRLPSLRGFEVGNVRWCVGLRADRHPHCLEKVAVRGRLLGPAAAGALRALAAGPRLARVCFAGARKLEDKDAEVIVSNCPSLKELELSACTRLSTPRIDAPGLKRLVLSKCPALLRVEGLHDIKGLTHLDLSWCTSLSGLEGGGGGESGAGEPAPSIQGEGAPPPPPLPGGTAAAAAAGGLPMPGDVSHLPPPGDPWGGGGGGGCCWVPWATLEELDVSYCGALEQLAVRGPAPALRALRAHGCTGLRALRVGTEGGGGGGGGGGGDGGGGGGGAPRLAALGVRGCAALAALGADLPRVEELELEFLLALRFLHLHGKRLRRLSLRGCSRLRAEGGCAAVVAPALEELDLCGTPLGAEALLGLPPRPRPLLGSAEGALGAGGGGQGTPPPPRPPALPVLRDNINTTEKDDEAAGGGGDSIAPEADCIEEGGNNEESFSVECKEDIIMTCKKKGVVLKVVEDKGARYLAKLVTTPLSNNDDVKLFPSLSLSPLSSREQLKQLKDEIL